MPQGDLETRWVQRALHDDRRFAGRPFLAADGPGRTSGGAPADLGLHWCTVPDATFVLRADEPTGDEDRSVSLSSFQVTRVPVSNAQYDRFVECGGYADERYWTVYGWRHRRANDWTGPSTGDDPDRTPDSPVTGVSWWEAMAFACWADAALPSEAQWELAARHSGSGATPTIDLRDPSAPPASPFGCLDMNGFVAEWCLDNDGFWTTGGGAHVDYVHESAETAPHVTRGGCGLHDASALCGNSRDHYAPGFRDHLVGFRLVRPAPTA